MEQLRKSSDRENIARQQAREALTLKDVAVADAAQAASRESYMLDLMTDASQDMAGMLRKLYILPLYLLAFVLLLYLYYVGSFVDAAAEDQRIDTRSNSLVKLALDHGCDFWATPDRTRRIVRFQDHTGQVCDYLDFCTRTLALVYNTMLPRNSQPKTMPDLMDKFRDVPRIHSFVKSQLTAGARFAMIMLQVCYPKFAMTNIVEIFHNKLKKRRRNVKKIYEVVTPVAEEIMDDLLRMDAEFFVKGNYADFMGVAASDERVNIDDLIEHD
jgi:hypothetical protein